MEPQQYKSYISPNEFQNDNDMEVKDEPMEMTEEFLITEEYPDYIEATGGDQDKHIHDGSQTSMAQDKESEMEMTYYECEICKAKFKSNLEANRHEKVHSFDKPFHCQSCEISFKKRRELNEHMKAHEEASRYRCKECSWRFVSRNDRDRERAFCNMSIETCLYCGNILSEEEQIGNDSEEKQVDENLQASKTQNEELAKIEETDECRICQVTFKSKCEAKRHANIHSFDKPFQCYECDNCYETSRNMQRHMNLHKVVSQYRCKECSLQFTNGNDRDCKRAFRNYRVKSCLYCGKKFSGIESNTSNSQSSSACEILIDDNTEVVEGDQQEDVHGNLEASKVQNEERAEIEETNQCKICCFMLKSSFEAKRHKRIHTIAKPFYCHSCSISFKKMHYLQNHMKIHQLVSQYRCKKCKFQFTNQDKEEYKSAFQKYQIASCLYCGNELPDIDEHMNDSEEELANDSLPASKDKNEGRAKMEDTDECKICEIKFKSNFEAKRHENIHSFDRPFQCHECDFKYQKKYYLQKHMKHHKLVSEYRCKECSFLFINHSDQELKNALRYPTEACLYCGEQLPVKYDIQPIVKKHGHPLIIAKEKVDDGCWYLVDTNTNCKPTSSDLEELQELEEESMKTTTKGFLISGEHSARVNALEECKRIMRKDQDGYVDDALQDTGVQNGNATGNSVEATSHQKFEGEWKVTATWEFLTSGEHANRVKALEEHGRIMQEDQDGYSDEFLRRTGVQNVNAAESGGSVEAKSNQKLEDEWKEMATEELLIYKKSEGKESVSFEVLERTREKSDNDNDLQESNRKNEKVDEAKKTHECAICKEKFKWEGEAKMHEVSHANEIPVDCHICKIKFKGIFYLEKHLKDHKEVSRHRCKYCRQRFSSHNDKDSVKYSRSNWLIASCFYCGSKLPSTGGKEDQFKPMGMVDEIKLDEDGDVLININTICRQALNKRKDTGVESSSAIMNVSQSKSSKNDGNDTVLASIINHPSKTLLLVKTMPKESGDGKEEDDNDTDNLIHTKTIRQLSARKLKEFLTNRHYYGDLSEDLSEETSKEDLREEQASPAQPGKRPYTEGPHECEICQKRFKWEFEAKVHKLDHGKERTFDCQACRLKFKTLGNLQKHTTDHEEASREKCQDCSWRFTSRTHDSLSSTDPDRASRINEITSCFYCAKDFPVKNFRIVSQNVKSSASTTKKDMDTQARNSGLVSLNVKSSASITKKDMDTQARNSGLVSLNVKSSASTTKKDMDAQARNSGLVSLNVKSSASTTKKDMDTQARNSGLVSLNVKSSASTTKKDMDAQARNSGLASLNEWQESLLLKDMLRVVKDDKTYVHEKDQPREKDQPKDDGKEEPKTQSEIMNRYPNILPKPQVVVPQTPVGQFLMPMQNSYMRPVYMPPVNFGFVQGFPQVQALPQVGNFNHMSSASQIHNNPTPQTPKTVEKPCACKTCGKLFQTKREVTKHQKEHHACRECGKKFRLKCQLDNHELGHGLAPRVPDKTTYICGKCGLSSTDYQEMQEHTLLHVREEMKRGR